MPTKKTKKRSLLSNLGSRIKTPKSKLLITMLAFSIIGGGILVYKSFAATAPSYQWNYSIGAGNITIQQGDCKVYNPKDSAKNNATVTNFVCPTGTRGWNGQQYQGRFRTKGGYLASKYVNRRFRACAYVKGTGDFNVSVELPNNAKSNRLNGFPYTVNRQSYGYYCSEYLRLTTVGAVIGDVSTGYKKANIYVGSLVIEMQ